MEPIRTFFITEVIGVFPHEWDSDICKGGRKKKKDNYFDHFYFTVM